MKKLVILAFILNLTFNASASIPESMPQTVYDGIVSQVMTDAGHYDAVKVEEAISQWLLDQPVPDNDGLLIESGSCSDCGADSQGTIAELPQPRNVKIKAKKNNNGSYTTTYKIKWKRPQDLANDSPYAFSHYNVYVSKDGESYETFEVTPKIKRNGRPKKRNKIKFKESQEGHYTVQVQAVYVDSSDQSKKDSNKAQKSIIYSASGWTEPKLYSLGKFDLHVSDLSGKLKDCVMGAGYGNNTLLKIFTKLDCRSSELVDSDIIQIENFNNLRSLIIDDNTDVTDISPLKNLAYLTLLSLEGNTGINLNFNKIIELEDLYLGRMGLTQLPNLSEMLDLEFLDLSNNNISGGFNKLPDSLTVLVLDDNKIKSCLGLDGITIETISLKGEKITSFENCSLVDGLSFFSIYDTPNLIGTHNIDNFSGFCSLELDKTGIKKLEGSRPIRSLTLTTNENLKNINVIKTGALEIGNSYPDLIPSYVSLDGSPNIKCENLFEVQQIWSDNTKLDMTVPVTTTVDGIQKDSPVCPVINYDFIFNKEASCKANKITNLSAIRSNSKIKYALTWDQTDHSKWGITSYQIRTNYVEGGEEIISTIPADFNFPLYLENSAQQPSFEVRACKTNDSDINNITTTCSNWSDSSWSPGLSKISSLEYNWIDQNNNLFELDFIYPQGDIAHESNVPDYFEVLSGLDINDSLLHTVNFISGLNDYTSQAIDLDNLLSREFRVRACKNPTSDHPKKCGRSKLIRVLEEITSNPSSTPAVPTLLSQPSQNNLNQGFIKFNVSSSQDVEYFDVVETQPVPVSDGAPIENLDNKKFYTVKAQGNQGHFDLIRKVNGKHYFRVSACKVAQGSIQGKKSHCSEPLELGFADNDPTNDNDWKIQRTVLNSALNNSSVDENLIDLDWKWITCNDIYDSNNRLDNGIGCIPTTIANEEDIIGGNNYIKTRLKWKYRNSSAQQSNITPPDYFHLSKVQQSDNGENIKAIDSPSTPNNNYNSIINMCIAKQPAIYDVDNPNTISPKYAKQQIIVPNDNSPSPPGVLSTFDTQKACKGGIRVSEDGLWKIKACYSGIGCTSGKEIDILADVQDQNDYENRGDIGDIRGREALYDPIVEEPAPDNLQSGLWWNPHQAGTGWYFHWKNNSTNPNRELKDSYNLLAHWIIYRKFNNGTWSPIWVYADMSLNQDNDNGDQIYSGQIYYSHIVGGLKTEQGLGTIKVLINPDQQNYRAKVELDIDSDNGLLTQDSINYDFAGDAGDYFEIDFGETGDEYDSITLPLEVFGIRLIGEDPDDTNTTGGVSNTTRFGLKNDIDHYSGLWEYEGSNDADDAIIAIWQKHNLEIMNFFIYDNAGQPFWLMSQTCGDPCSVPVSGYFDQYINAKTGEHEFGIEESGTFNFNTKVDGGFNPLGYKPDEPWHEVEFLAKAGRLLADDTNTTLQPYKQGKFWLDINAPISNANRHVTRQLGVEPNLDGPYSSLLTMNKIANINHIGFNLKDYRGDIQFDDEEENIIATTCDPNVTGYCTVDFNWYTESSTNGLPLKPYYKFGDMESFEPLTSGLEGLDCTTTPPSGNFVDSYKCMLLTEGEYEFQLKREKYSGTGYTIIAESAKLTSIACDDNCNRDESYVDQSQLPFIGPDSIGPDEDGNGDGDGILELSDLPTAPDSSSIVGTTKGNFSVSPNGAANYSIPILTAPGSGGLVPQASINYNSQSSRSALGKGWSVSGYSAISRCAQTFAQDYVSDTGPLVLGVNFSATDKFCVNGKRLFLTSDSTQGYGEDGATYYSEINDFTLYTSYGDTGGDSPECFVAQNKNGSEIYYGDCDSATYDDSAFVHSGLQSGMATMWAQSRVIDNKGNYYNNYYHSTVINGVIEFYLDTILYTANLNVSGVGLDLENPTNLGQIKFNYTNPSSSEITKNVISVSPYVEIYNNSKSLQSITSSYGNETIRHYKLNYVETDSAGFKLLSSIEECSDNLGNTCLDPTIFTWGNKIANLIGSSVVYDDLTIENPIANNIANKINRFDANADGLEDLYYTTSTLKVGLNLPNGDYVWTSVHSDFDDSNVLSSPVKTADLNADGFPDFIHRGFIYLCLGEQFDDFGASLGVTYTKVDNLSINGEDLFAQEAHDFNGDGLIDIINFKDNSINADDTKLQIYINRFDNADGDFSNAFNTVIDIDLGIKNYYLNPDNEPRPSIFKNSEYNIETFDQISLNQITDINGDGVAELVFDIETSLACVENATNCNIPGTERTTLKAIAYLEKDETAFGYSYRLQHIAGDIKCTECTEQISQERFVDITADGQPEFCYIEIINQENSAARIDYWACISKLDQIQTDRISTIPKIVYMDVHQSSSDVIGFIDYQDLDGDGYLDFLYSKGQEGGENKKWQWKKSTWNNGDIVLADSWSPTGLLAGVTNVAPNQDHLRSTNLFTDLNNDGLIDHLHINVDSSDLSLDVYRALGSSLASSYDKEKITDITDGLGKKIHIEYLPMSDSRIYTRDNNSVADWFDDIGNPRSPVYDFNSNLSLVYSYDMDMPAYSHIGTISNSPNYEINWTQHYQYHYAKGKLQAGGRGFLGFQIVQKFNANNGMLTENKYHQSFPYTGQIAEANKYYLKDDTPESLRASIEPSNQPCWVDASCTSGIPETDQRLAQEGLIDELTLLQPFTTDVDDLVSSVVTEWNYKDTLNGTYFVYPEIITSVQYDLQGEIDNTLENRQIGRTKTENYFDESPDFYGNPTQVIKYSYDFDDVAPTHVLKETTDMIYKYATEDGIYYVNRPEKTTVTHSRPNDSNNEPNQVRITDYEYYPNRFLKKEIVSTQDSLEALIRTYESIDSYGNPEKVKITARDLNGLVVPLKNRTTEKNYDVTGRFVDNSKIDSQIEQTVISRNRFGQPTQTINKQGISTFYSYDDFGKLYYQINELGQFNQIEHKYISEQDTIECATGTVYYTENSSSGPKTWQCFDKLNREVSSLTQRFKNPAPNSNETDKVIIHSHYDHVGRLLQKSKNSFIVPSLTTSADWNRFKYDVLNRVTDRKNANGEVTQTYYLPLSVSVENAKGQKTTTNRNMLDEVEKIIDAQGNPITYKYDDIGNQIEINGPLPAEMFNGQTIDDIISIQYDDFDHVKEINDPDLGTWTYKYNLFAELEYQRDSEGNCSVMEYDNMNRMTKRTYVVNADFMCTIVDQNTESVSEWTYDNNQNSSSYGLLLVEDKSINDSSVITQSYSYDDWSRLDTVSTNIIDSDIIGGNQTYSQINYYDQYSRNLANTDATGGSVRYEYNNNGYLTETIDQFNFTVYQKIEDIDAFGNLADITFDNGVRTLNTYDNLGRIRNISTSSGASIIQELEYYYDTVGNLVSREDKRIASTPFYEEFCYDSLNRLEVVKSIAGTCTTPVNPTMSLSYDEGGRITVFNNSIYTYNGSGHIHGVHQINDPLTGMKTFEYDDNGSQTLSNGRNIDYTAFNKAHSIINGINHAYFKYDANNNRYKRRDINNGNLEITYYIGNAEFVTDYSTGGITKSKRYIADAVITQVVGGSNEGIKYLHRDHLGSVQSVTNENGASDNHLSYDAYGNRREAGNNSSPIAYNPIADVTKRGYTGQEHIDQLGIIHYNARLYDPSLGVMLQADTIIPDGPVSQSLNRYSYVYNNPLSYTDPTGHEGKSETAEVKNAGVHVRITFKDGTSRIVTMSNKDYKLLRKEISSNNAFGRTALIVGVTPNVFNNSDTSDAPSAENTDDNESMSIYVGEASYLRSAGADYVDGHFWKRISGTVEASAAMFDPREDLYAILDCATTFSGCGAVVIGLITRRADRLGEFYQVTKGAIQKGKKGKKASKPDCNNCLVAGTLIVTSTGLKPIEEIQIGDMVWAKDSDTGEFDWKPVISLFTNIPKPIFSIEIQVDGKVSTIIESTNDHPFFVAGKGWVETDELQKGDQLESKFGLNITVSNVELTGYDEVTYNFTVDDFHTYYVTEYGVLVHNCEVTGHHGTTADNIDSIRKDGVMKPKKGEIYLSENKHDTFQHGGDINLGGNLSANVTVNTSDANSVLRVSKPGNPNTILIKTDVPLPAKVKNATIRKPDGKGGFTYDDYK